MTTIYLIRHGQSIGNATRTYLGHTDLDLTGLGYAQAEETAKALSGVPFTAVYTSDLLRARHTAEPHARRRGLEVKLCPALREVCCGEWEGRTAKELAEAYPEAYLVGFRQSFGTFEMPGGESIPEVGERAHGALLEIAKAHPGQTVLAVSHGGTIRMLWAIISGIAAEQVGTSLPFPSNASYSVLEYDGEKLVSVEYSVDSHMPNVTHVHL